MEKTELCCAEQRICLADFWAWFWAVLERGRNQETSAAGAERIRGILLRGRGPLRDCDCGAARAVHVSSEDRLSER